MATFTVIFEFISYLDLPGFYFEHINNTWGCSVCTLKITIQVTTNSLENLTRTILLLQFPPRVFQIKQNYKSTLEISKKIVTLKLRRFELVGDMENLSPFIQGSLDRSFSKLSLSDVSLCNRYKYIAF